MTSDDLFWRLVVAMRTVDEAALLWWLAAVRADEHAHRSSNRAVSRQLGDAVTRKTLDRTARRLTEAGTLTTRVLRNRYTEYRLDGVALAGIVQRAPQGQLGPLNVCGSVGQLDPIGGWPLGVPESTVGSRLSLLRGSREDSLLLIWLLQAGAHGRPVCVSGRDLSAALLGLIDRRTAMRAFARLESAGLVTVTPMARSGTEYSLDESALHDLVHQPFPFHEDAAATMPGWANLDFPLLHRLTRAVPAEPVTAVNDATVEA
jgi:hypothetical protein